MENQVTTYLFRSGYSYEVMKVLVDFIYVVSTNITVPEQFFDGYSEN